MTNKHSPSTSIHLYDLLLQSAHAACALQEASGEFPKGHNGPWEDDDTSVRTTAHWTLLLYKAYQISGKDEFINRAIKGCDFLVSSSVRPFKKTFYCRTDVTGKDRCNGLIGQAWAVEPLLILGEALNNEYYLNVADEVLRLHPYDWHRHGWMSIDIDGHVFNVHRTLNQQVWFAAMALRAGKRVQSLRGRAIDFLQHLPNSIEWLDTGLIKHTYLTRPKETLRNIAKRILEPSLFIADKRREKQLSEGYLTFILYALAMTYAETGAEAVWQQAKFKRIVADSLHYTLNNYPYGYALNSSDFRWAYNPVGIEIAYILQVFGEYVDLQFDKCELTKWLSLQLGNYFDCTSNLMVRNTDDPMILSARLYEAIRLNDYVLHP